MQLNARPAARFASVSKIKTAAYLLVVLAWVWVIATVWRGPGEHQFDFKTYYVAVQVYERGDNPYDIHQIRESGRSPHLLGFYYPLATLNLLRPLGHMDYVDAYRVWFALKVLALAALLMIWKRFFLPKPDWLFLIVALLGFQAATVWDLKTGNVTVFEQLWLWAGFAFLARARATAFVVCIVIASLAKLLPGVFLLLLFLPALRSRANTVRALAGGLAIAAITLLPFFLNPEYFGEFLHGVTTQQPPFRVNPSVLGIVDEMGRHPTTAFLADGWMKLVPIAAYYGLLLTVSWHLLERAAASSNVSGIILVAALFYPLAAPRLIVYSGMIAIVPVLALLVPNVGRSKVGEYALLTAVCLSGLAILPTPLGTVAGDAVPLLLLWGSWLALVAMDRRGELVGV